ncbi:MAG: acyltransferase domain-containing protein [Candidatus Electrothrix sp. EH2]|nr:acyltransferase domain-containing protein [Candidatus Electrothrix sp. EH2]
MLAVPLSAAQMQDRLNADISLAVINTPQRCVVSGTHQAIARLQHKLHVLGIESRILHTSHAFHSHLLEPVMGSFDEKLRRISFNPPHIPYLSNLTGDWIRPEQAVAPDYWVSHLRNTVRFSDNVHALFKHRSDILLEAGPGQTLSALIRQHPEYSEQCVLLSSLPRQRDTSGQAELKQILSTLGQLWCHGVMVSMLTGRPFMLKRNAAVCRSGGSCG